MPSDFKDLRVWQIAQKFMLEVYKVTSNFPKAERFNLTDQLRRAPLKVIKCFNFRKKEIR